MTYAVIPAKAFHGAKQRLASFLTPQERLALARAMLTDTLTACTQATGLQGVGVVTCDRDVAAVVEALQADVLWEPQSQGHSHAVSFGVHTCQQRGITSMLTLPGDLPLLTAADVDRIVAAPQQAAPIILVPSHDELGTNALVLSPPDCLPFAFGHDSFQRHMQLAAARHLHVDVRRIPHVALDIDEPQDLAAFAAQGTAGHSLQLLQTLGLIERLLQAFPAQGRSLAPTQES